MFVLKVTWADSPRSGKSKYPDLVAFCLDPNFVSLATENWIGLNYANKVVHTLWTTFDAAQNAKSVLEQKVSQFPEWYNNQTPQFEITSLEESPLTRDDFVDDGEMARFKRHIISFVPKHKLNR